MTGQTVEDKLELLYISFSAMVRTKGETLNIPDFFFFHSSEALLMCG